ncbi:hypothetical protein KSC_088690 [Ktedonobacter sp. SOSP1-52]|nr:hypothetical protein KSC_088690 [Ktedonobacter sp. SOSP1-52]
MPLHHLIANEGGTTEVNVLSSFATKRAFFLWSLLENLSALVPEWGSASHESGAAPPNGGWFSPKKGIDQEKESLHNGR